MTSEGVAVTRRVAASAEERFAIVSNPTGHVDLDASGMLVAAPDARPLAAVGETFDMDMDREPLGDDPELGKYQVRNTVTHFVPGRLFEWSGVASTVRRSVMSRHHPVEGGTTCSIP